MLLLHLALAREMQNYPTCLTHDMPELELLFLQQTYPSRAAKTPVPMILHLAYIGSPYRIFFRQNVSSLGLESRMCWRWIASGLASHQSV